MASTSIIIFSATAVRYETLDMVGPRRYAHSQIWQNLTREMNLEGERAGKILSYRHTFSSDVRCDNGQRSAEKGLCNITLRWIRLCYLPLLTGFNRCFLCAHGDDYLDR